MTLNEIISKLIFLREDIGTGGIPVFIEVNGQQEKFGNYDFTIHHHYHEENIYKGILQEEINEIILMPEVNWVEEEDDN